MSRNVYQIKRLMRRAHKLAMRLFSYFFLLLLFVVCSCGTESSSGNDSDAGLSSDSSESSVSTKKEIVPEASSSELQQMTREEKLEYMRNRAEAKLTAAQREKLIKIQAEQNRAAEQMANEGANVEGSIGEAAAKAAANPQLEQAMNESGFAKDLVNFVKAGKMDKRRRFILDEVSFHPKTGNLNPESNRQIALLKQIMDKYPRLNIGFLTYTSSTALADQQAKETEAKGKLLSNYLVSKGVAGNRVGYQGMGNQMAKFPNSKADRVELVVMGL